MTADLNTNPKNNTTDWHTDPHPPHKQQFGNIRIKDTSRSPLMTHHQNTTAQMIMIVTQRMIWTKCALSHCTPMERATQWRHHHHHPYHRLPHSHRTCSQVLPRINRLGSCYLTDQTLNLWTDWRLLQNTYIIHGSQTKHCRWFTHDYFRIYSIAS